MKKYIDKQTVSTYLNLGKTIEVFLGRISNDKSIICYLDIVRTKDTDIELTYYEVYDEGNLEFLDLYSFSSVDPDMDFETYRFDHIDRVIEFIHERFKVTEIKFVNAGIIQNEYEDLLISEGRS